MRNASLLFLLLLSNSLFAQTWTPRKSYPNINGSPQAVTFTLNDEIYILGGYFSVGFYKYTPSTDNWKNMGNLPFSLTHDYTQGVAFEINGKGYICAGEDGPDMLADLWEYDAVANKWTKKAPYPGIGRIGLIAFTIGSKAYVGCGNDGKNVGNGIDLYEYDPSADTWFKKADCPAQGYFGQFSFVFTLNNKGYISTRLAPGATIKNDTYEYDPFSDKWTLKAPFPGVERMDGLCYVYNGKAYCGLGGDITGVNKYKDMFVYDPLNDSWQQGADFPVGERFYGIAVVVNNSVYAGLGADNDSYPWQLKKDWYEFSLFPASTACIVSNNKISLYPCPANNTLNVQLDKYDVATTNYLIHDFIGRQMQSGKVPSNKAIDISSLPEGQYLLTLSGYDFNVQTLVFRKR